MSKTNATPRKLYDNGVLIRLRAPGWSATKAYRRIREAACSATGANITSVSGSKYLIPRHYLKGIKAPVDEARRAIADVSIPWSANKSDDRGNRKEDAMWLCPTMRLPDLEKKLRACRQGREDALKDLVRNYPTILAEMRVSLGSLHDDDDYPTVEELQAKFSWDVDITPLWSLANVENDLRLKLPAAWAEEQVEHARREEGKRIANAVAMVAQEAVDFVEETASKLKEYNPSDDDGRKGNTFKNKTLFKNVTRLREKLEQVNVMLEDDAIRDTVDALKSVESTLDGLDPAEIRKSEETRKAVAKALEDASAKARPATDRLGDLLG
jgi:hypothetical protein